MPSVSNNRRAMIAISLTVGVSMAWGVLAFWGYLIVDSVRTASDASTFQRLIFDGAGRPIVETRARWQQQPPKYATLDGEPIDELDEEWETKRYSYAGMYPAFPSETPPLSLPTRPFHAFHSTTEPGVFWYYVHSGTIGGGAWFEGFSAGTRQRAGYLGVNGFSHSLPQGPERFPVNPRLSKVSSSWSTQTSYYSQGVAIPLKTWEGPTRLLDHSVCVPGQDNVYVVDLRDGAVRKLLPSDQAVQNVRIEVSADRRDGRTRLAVLTDKELQIFDDQLQPESRWTLPPDLRPNQITWVTGTDGSTWLAANIAARISTVTSYKLLHWSSTGELLERRDLELNNLTNPSAKSWGIPLSIGIPSPMVMSATVFVIVPYVMHLENLTPWPEAVAENLVAGGFAGLILAGLAGCLSALLTGRHARQQDLPRNEVILWTAFALLIGPAAYLGYRFHRRWPRQLPCPAGGHTLPADHFDCPTCHKEWPLPEMKGIEVLEPAEA